MAYVIQYMENVMTDKISREAKTVNTLLESLKDNQELYIIYGLTGKDRRVKVLGIDEYGTIKTASKPDITPKLLGMLINPRYKIMECIEKGWIDS